MVFDVSTIGTERLEFEIFHHLASEDDGCYDGAQAELDKLRFFDIYLLNGKLEIRASMNRLSRKDAFLSVNINISATHKSYQEKIAAAEKKNSPNKPASILQALSGQNLAFGMLLRNSRK